ncbi:lipoprotein-releasing ABC transporter permease subunit [Achromobacter sp. GG226]|uniref:lipoprotein-releasing ABC transporter permease subunit n=1 Tax=Verticiella alkaliphila TaxID=2779529 RepID=UPI001C0D527D|nr:lipoprotein-releasing ABC transporter permease subunit [Verticiella sp. GG226]MBU4610819.1 lipoprotein-releasing ABC transporter permease subunit [Verticiella sp. GG226]
MPLVKNLYELWIGWRYTRAGGGRRRDRFLSFISASSMAGIALGVAALIIVMSVMNGFQKEVRDRMLSVLPHVEVFARGTSALEHWQELASIAEKNPAVQAGAPYVSAQAMLARDQVLRGVQVNGVDPKAERGVSEIADQMVLGTIDDLQPGNFNIVLGQNLARALGLTVGSPVLVMAPQGSVTPAGFTPRMRQFTLSGVFHSGHYEYDSSLAFINVDDAAKLFRDSAVGGVRLRIADMLRAPEVTLELAAALPQGLRVSDWSQNNQTWFAAVQTEKRMMFIILALIVAVAAFNLLSSLVMAVNDKQSDIAILRTLGASPRSVAWIFVVQGAFIGIIGTVAGVGLGTLIAYNIDVIVPFIERVFGIEFLPQQIYFISQLPSDPRSGDIITVGITALVLALVATLYPSWRASRLQPAEVLRHD